MWIPADTTRATSPAHSPGTGRPNCRTPFAATLPSLKRSSERSSHTWFVLKYLLGIKNVRNYDGSWTECGNLIGAPIEKEASSAATK
jgi:hypothetical protein